MGLFQIWLDFLQDPNGIVIVGVGLYIGMLYGMGGFSSSGEKNISLEAYFYFFS